MLYGFILDVGNQISHNNTCVQRIKTHLYITLTHQAGLARVVTRRYKISVHNFDASALLLTPGDVVGRNPIEIP